jgi:SAM-dependent methyltransferase
MKSEPIAEFFDRECCAFAAHPDEPDGELDRVSEMLLEAVAASGLSGATVLELGSGDGSLSRELLRRGAAAVTGIDLSPRSVEYAAGRATDAGLAERADYRVGDAAVAKLEQHDIVASNRVFCCYPDPEQLLANTLPAARRLYVLALPESRGVVGVASRLVVRVANAWQWLRRDPFRAYVHDVRRLEHTVREAGLEPVSSRRHRGWLALAFSRD